MKKFRIGITGIMNNDHPSGGVSLAKAIKRWANPSEIEVILIAQTPYDTGIFLDNIAEEIHILAPHYYPINDLEERWENLCEKINLDFLILCDIDSYNNLMPLITKIQKKRAHIPLPMKDVLQLISPTKLYQVSISIGIPAVPTFELLDYPPTYEGKVIKMWRTDGKLYLIHSEKEIEGAIKSLKRKNLPIYYQHLQEGKNIQVAGFSDTQGNLLSFASVESIAEVEDRTIWMGVSFKEQHLLNIFKNLIKRIGWYGFFTANLIKTEKDDYNLIDFYPFPPSWIEMTEIEGEGLSKTAFDYLINFKRTDEVNYFEGGYFFAHYVYDTPVKLENFINFTLKGGKRTDD